MWLIARLHYAFRALWVALDRVKTSRAVEQKWHTDCCDAVEIRVCTPQHMRNHCPRVIISHAPNSLPLEVAMRQSSAIRCTIANEFLRRRNRAHPEATTRPDLKEHCAGCTGELFENVPIKSTGFDQTSLPEHSRRGVRGQSQAGAPIASAANESMVGNKTKVTFAPDRTGAGLGRIFPTYQRPKFFTTV